MFNYQLRNIAF